MYVQEVCMETKLTLKLDKSIIHSVKQYAKTNNRSLSSLVEDYFRNLLLENQPQKQYSPLVEELSGIISEKELENFNYVDYLEQKYE